VSIRCPNELSSETMALSQRLYPCRVVLKAIVVPLYVDHALFGHVFTVEMSTRGTRAQ
jgi:hypothetical protein